MNFKKFFGIQSKKEKIDEYRNLRKSLAALDMKGQELAEEFSYRKSMVTNLNLIPDDKRDEIIKSYGEFVRKHNDEVVSVMNQRASILKSIKDFHNSSVGKICKKIAFFEQIRKSYSEGHIQKPLFDELMKGLNGGKVRYSDVVAINKETGDMLILHRVNDDLTPSGEVCIPGGHVYPGETFEEAAIRELKEETNLDPMKEFGLVELGKYETKDVEIHYFLVRVDPLQPVVCEGSENVYYEWITLGEIPLKPFIFDQGELVYKFMTTPAQENIKPIMDAYAEKRMSCDAMIDGVSSEICKAFGLNYEPLMPESLEGGKKRMKVSVRDPFCCMEGAFKSINGEANCVVCGNEVDFDEPIFIHETSYSEDPSFGRTCEFGVTFSGNESDVRKLVEALVKFGSSIKMSVKTPHEEFVSVNDNGIDYVGEPVFVE